MKYLFVFLMISCTSQVPSVLVKPSQRKHRVKTKVITSTPPTVKLGSCFISSVSDSIYKVIRCNTDYCQVKNNVFDTVMEKVFVSKQLPVKCPKYLK